MHSITNVDSNKLSAFIVSVVSLVISLIAAIVSIQTNLIAKEANEIAKESNLIADKANQILLLSNSAEAKLLFKSPGETLTITGCQNQEDGLYYIIFSLGDKFVI